MVESFGWPAFFLCTFVIALPGLGLLWSQRAQVRALESAAPIPLRSPG
jgi:PAT family beta-lactamase induction signal transducer AmpG